jgi:anaerobic selenocysteine-containing dehydrogenase
MGTCVQEFGALATWLIDVVAAVTGNLDRPGGAMFGANPVDLPQIASWFGRRGAFDRWRSASGLPEFNGELPVAAFADELESGEVGALLVQAGNPVLSLPNGRRIERALERLPFVASIDIYLNETSRHAHVILPSTFGLENAHFPLLTGSLAVRDHVRYDGPAVPSPPEARPNWWILGQIADRLLRRRGIFGRIAASAASVVLDRGPELLLDGFLRAGPHRMRLEDLQAAAHGIDLGPLEPRLAQRLRGRRIDLLPAGAVADIARLERRLGEASPQIVLIGRRDLRTNNSWMHNVEHLARGKRRCTLLVHPDDAAARGICDGQLVQIVSAVGSLVAPAQITDEVARGVVSLPHGWGHGRAGTRLDVANAHAGVSANDLTDDRRLDLVSGTSAVNGVPVELHPA